MKVFSTNYRFDGEKKILNGCSVYLNRGEIDFILYAYQKAPKSSNVVTESNRESFVNFLNLIPDERKS